MLSVCLSVAVWLSFAIGSEFGAELTVGGSCFFGTNHSARVPFRAHPPTPKRPYYSFFPLSDHWRPLSDTDSDKKERTSHLTAEGAPQIDRGTEEEEELGEERRERREIAQQQAGECESTECPHTVSDTLTRRRR